MLGSAWIRRLARAYLEEDVTAGSSMEDHGAATSGDDKRSQGEVDEEETATACGSSWRDEERRRFLRRSERSTTDVAWLASTDGGDRGCWSTKKEKSMEVVAVGEARRRKRRWGEGRLLHEKIL